MKKIVIIGLLLLGLALIAMSLVPPRNPGAFDIVGFGKLPVVVNGRVKPFDTVARSSLLQIQGKQTVLRPDYRDPTGAEWWGALTGSKPLPDACRPLKPTEWLLDMFFRSEQADTYQVIAIDNPDLLSLLNLRREDGLANRRFSFAQVEKSLAEIDRQAQLAEPVEPPLRSSFQRAVVQLQANVILYLRLKESLVSSDSQDFLAEVFTFEGLLSAGVEAVHAKEAKQPYDAAAAHRLIESGQRFDHMARLGYALAIPPAKGESDTNGWRNSGSALLETFQTGKVNRHVMAYAGLGHAWAGKSSVDFNNILRLYREELEQGFPKALAKCAAEARFNATKPFITAMSLYLLAFLVALISWLKWPVELGRVGFWLVAAAWLIATTGILTRMWLEGRPPVTNLYSSALFVGWIAVAFCLALEYFFRNAIGTAAGGFIGFCTLLIAYVLSLDGDTLEMMRAVLDSNFWLATHVVTVVAGYGATFLAGILALIYIVLGIFTPLLKRTPTRESAIAITAVALSPALTAAAIHATKTSETNGKMLERMVYGIVCFATLFSLIGTVLGGIWADQSWGRFWGWDPKENGALIIVIWNAVFLHARWGGLLKARGLMCLAVFGNIVTSWSWFGVNLLGVGLHNYGFVEATFWWLIAFVITQVAFIVLANLPLEKWRSFKPAPTKTS